MKSAKKLTGVALATAAATLLLAGCGEGSSTESGASSAAAPAAAPAATEEAKVHCMGINSCKGTTACATADNQCKGMNSCKGKGWLPKTKAECDTAGGTVAG
jgi:uncharacterized lipoprotein YajG